MYTFTKLKYVTESRVLEVGDIKQSSNCLVSRG